MTQYTAGPRSYKVGERGINRVRLAEDPKRGDRLFVEFRERDGRKVRQYLPHRDWEKGKAQAEAMASAHRTLPTQRQRSGTLRELFDIYLREVTPTKGRGTQQHDHAAADLFITCWGATRNPETLGLRDWQRFIADRSSGRLSPKGTPNRQHRRGVRDRQIAYDLKWVRAVFRWATLAGDQAGGALLGRDPTAGFPLPSEASPSRPRMSEERYQAMLAVAATVHPDFHLALVLGHETGHRLSSIRQLWWSDIRWDDAMVRWRGEADKEGTAHQTPLTPAAVDALRAARVRSSAVGDVWIFAESHGGVSPRSRSTFAKWWHEAEGLAGLEREPRLAWHSLRRQFATELKDTPLTDLAALGGWNSTATILTCYQQPDVDTMRRALATRRSLSSAGRMESTNGEQAAAAQ